MKSNKVGFRSFFLFLCYFILYLCTYIVELCYYGIGKLWNYDDGVSDEVNNEISILCHSGTFIMEKYMEL